MSDATTTELLALNRRLLESIAAGDWAAYEELCAPISPASSRRPAGSGSRGWSSIISTSSWAARAGPFNITVSAPHVRLMGDVAVISYIRLVQKLDAAGNPVTARSEETRVWQRQNGRWRHVHFHRAVG